MEYAASIEHVEMPDRIKRLPISPKGFPVPWFVAWFDGVPDFRVVGPGKVEEAIKKDKCWVCGDRMGAYKAMTLGPMCVINRTISEPPAHRECAVFSVKACPFLSNPKSRRNECNIPTGVEEPAGNAIKRNPGAVAIWVTKRYQPFRDRDGGILFTFDNPTEVLWFCEGRTAIRQEVLDSITSGLPILAEQAKREGEQSMKALEHMTARAIQYLPVA